MRKYDKKNKKNIFIVILICTIILFGFFLFINRYNDLEKKNYVIDVNSILYDKDKNKLNLDSTGTIKPKWNGNYYINYKDKEIQLDKKVVVFNKATKTINLYGTFYKINKDESVEKLKEETIINDTIVPKFYKLQDRKYLLVGKSIKDESEKFVADDYLIVELDKMGNAILKNDKINMKTLKETKLITSAYTFDIANEILNFGEKEVDLKKIIGTTNQYKPEESEEENVTPESGNGGNSENSENNSENQNNNGVGNEQIDTNIYQDKNFSVIKNTVGTNFLDIDYSIYDPKNEYTNVYLEIVNLKSLENEVYYLSKNGNSLRINGLLPNEEYKISYKYNYLENEINKTGTFDMDYQIKTQLPVSEIKISKLTADKIYYSLNIEHEILKGAKIELYINDKKQDEFTFNSENYVKKFEGTFDLNKDETINYIKLKCPMIIINTGTITTDIEANTKY